MPWEAAPQENWAQKGVKGTLKVPFASELNMVYWNSCFLINLQHFYITFNDEMEGACVCLSNKTELVILLYIR